MTPVLAAPEPAQAVFFFTSALPTGAMLAALPLAILASVRLPGLLRPVLARSTALPLRSFLVGLLAALATLLLLAASKASPIFGIAGVLSLAAASAFAFLGLVAEARRLGCEVRGIDPSGDGAGGGSLALGWLVLAGLPLLFVVGPLVLLYLALRSTGATVVALATRE